jgi:hypothetical protein
MWSVRRKFAGMMQVMFNPSVPRVGVGVVDLVDRRVIEECIGCAPCNQVSGQG